MRKCGDCAYFDEDKCECLNPLEINERTVRVKADTIARACRGFQWKAIEVAIRYGLLPTGSYMERWVYPIGFPVKERRKWRKMLVVFHIAKGEDRIRIARLLKGQRIQPADPEKRRLFEQICNGRDLEWSKQFAPLSPKKRNIHPDLRYVRELYGVKTSKVAGNVIYF